MGRKSSVSADMLPNFVRDISTANCVFCPYGADAQPGDRLYVYDEKTVYGRPQRERLVEVTSVKRRRHHRLPHPARPGGGAHGQAQKQPRLPSRAYLGAFPAVVT